jgi:peptidyl-prolyl cis-trans isomerase C
MWAPVAAAQDEVSEPKPEPLAVEINSKQITQKEIREQYNNHPQAKLLAFEAVYPDIVDYFIDEELLYSAAEKAKLEDNAEVQKLIAKARREAIVSYYIKSRIDSMMNKNQLKRLYREYIKQNPPAEEVRASHILVASQADADEVIARLHKGEEFAKIAREKSVDTTSSTGGDLGYFTRNQMVEEFAEAACKMKKGAYSKKPVKTKFGYHVIMITDKRKGQPPSFEAVEEALQKEFAQRSYDKMTKDLRAKAKIKRYKLEEGK